MKKKVNIKLIILLAVIAIVVVLIIVKKVKDSKFEAEVEAEQQRLAEQQAEYNNSPSSDGNTPTVMPVGTDEKIDVFVDEMQLQLIEAYGKAPDGFKWSMNGDLIPTGSSEYTSEEVLYIYFRGLSMQDFAVVERYSLGSSLVAKYKALRESSNSSSYNRFLARQFTAALSHLQLETDRDVAIFADGLEYHNAEYTTLDFRDKDFYLKDRDTLFEQLAEIYRVENDYEKVQTALFEYVLDQYNSPDFKRRTYSIEMKIEPADEGFLITDDDALCEQLLYENGVDAIEYILNDFSEYASQYFEDYAEFGNFNRFNTTPEDDSYGDEDGDPFPIGD